MSNREFRGIWIPKEVWFDERLNPLEKVILFEIDSLDLGDSGCFASNEYIARFCKCSEWKVSNAITKLVDLGYISIQSFDGRHRNLKSRLGFFTRLPCDFPKAALGISQDMNTSSINTSNEHQISISVIHPKDEIPASFDRFWKVYPRKVNKTGAVKAWKSLKPNDSTVEEIIADVNRRLRKEWRGKDMTYIPHPSTYINQKRWEDETEVTEIARPTEPTNEDILASLSPEELAAIDAINARGENYG